MKKRFEIKKGVFMEDNALYGEFDWLGVHIDINKIVFIAYYAF